MPTIMTHAIVPLAIAVAAGPQRIPAKIALAGMALAMLPDADVIGFKLGIAYADTWGHRGATHSLALACLVALMLAVIWRAARDRYALPFLACAMASHGLLDMLTDGGLGIALLWPFETTRHFAPATPIRVSPIGAGFFSQRGLETLWSVLIWVWLPALLLAGVALLWRRAAARPISR